MQEKVTRVQDIAAKNFEGEEKDIGGHHRNCEGTDVSKVRINSQQIMLAPGIVNKRS
jgi:hypothetical protein